MGKVALISGSPSAASRTVGLLRYAADYLEKEGQEVVWVNVRELPAEDLLLARYDSSPIAAANELVAAADAVVIGTPVYKASYTGLLKCYLDLLPQKGFAEKVVLPFAVGGTIAHLLSIDYALKPVLSTLGQPRILGGAFILDSQIAMKDGKAELDGEIAARVEKSLNELAGELRWNIQHREWLKKETLKVNP